MNQSNLLMKFLLSALLVMILSSCAADQQVESSASGVSEISPNQVVVLGMIHSKHRTSTLYSLDRLEQTLRRIKPDAVLCEIPPDRLAAAQQEFDATGKITESRVRVFPEYVDVLFPLQKELGFQIVPCAGWTKSMADARRIKLKQWQTTRPEDTRLAHEAQARADEEIQKLGQPDDPMVIHTDQYDQIVRLGLEPYNRLFNDDLGPGGWDNINQAHYDLIAAALDERTNQNLRLVITFGSWHKYWIINHLGERTDITLVDPKPFFED